MSPWVEEIVRPAAMFSSSTQNHLPTKSTSVRAWLCLKVVLNGAVFISRKKGTLAKHMIYAATATFLFCCNSNADAEHTFLNSGFAERTISPATATFSVVCVKEKCGVCFGVFVCVRARVDARAAVNVQLNNVAVVAEIVRPAVMCSSSPQIQDTSKHTQIHRNKCVPVAAATSVRAWLCLKVLLNGAVSSS
jgi:hypothetical protein